MRRPLARLAIVIAALAMSAGSAAAQVNVDLAFTPSTASPGDHVTLFASIANQGNAPVVADLQVTIAVNGFDLGPFTGRLPLAAGQELSREFTFVVPPVVSGGTLTLTVTATAGGFSDTATATLTIVGGNVVATNENAVRALGLGVLQALVGRQGTLAVQNSSMTQVKEMYR